MVGSRQSMGRVGSPDLESICSHLWLWLPLNSTMSPGGDREATLLFHHSAMMENCKAIRHKLC